MLSKWIYIPIGNNNTGKTTFQKRLIYHLCGITYVRLDRNTIHDINHPNSPKKMKKLSTINRSYQESKKEYDSIKNYFDNFFKDVDVCILSSHVTDCLDDVMKMIQYGHRRKYNIGGIFFSNQEDTIENQKIAKLKWDERFYLENPVSDNQEVWERQIDNLAKEFSDMIVARAYLQ